MKPKRGYLPPVLLIWLTSWFVAIPFSGFAHLLRAAEIDWQPGDTIGPHNWQKVQGMVGEHLLSRIKQGYMFKVREAKNFKPPKEYLEAMDRYATLQTVMRGGAIR
jgi:hypothetical protein